MKSKIIGDGVGEVTEYRILNRIIKITKNGWELEADQRHVDIMVEQMNLKGANGVNAPCEDDKPWELEDNQAALGDGEARRYRELAARANHLAQDRMDIQYAT